MDDKDNMNPRTQSADYCSSDRTMPGRRDRVAARRFMPGDLIMQRYEILAELGQGGMGVVYRCLDVIAGIEVALKALPPELSHDALEMEDIKENFQLIAKLVHQNIAISKQLEKDESNGNYYLIMECCGGDDLRRWIKMKRKEKQLTLEDILPIIRQVATALDYAHEQQIVHRDIKPGNIMVDSAGVVKILDFGLAAQIHSSMSRASMAYQGTAGTGPYMAPEQWRGRTHGASVDQYALGVMVYEMLAGRMPFDCADTAMLRESVLNDTPEVISGVPRHVAAAIARAMEKDASKRFDSCQDFVDALEGKKVKGHNTTGGLSRNILLLLLLLPIICAAFFCYDRYKQQDDNTQGATIVKGDQESFTIDAEVKITDTDADAEAEARRKAEAAARKAKAEAEARTKAEAEAVKSKMEEAKRRMEEAKRRMEEMKREAAARKAKAEAAAAARRAEAEAAARKAKAEAVRTEADDDDDDDDDNDDDDDDEQAHKAEEEKVRRSRIETFIKSAEKAKTSRKWNEVLKFAELALKLDKNNTVALALKSEAKQNMKKNLMEVKTFTLADDVKLEMVKIPAGTFLMGAPLGELGRRNNEMLHKVTITKAFWIGKYEVTQAQWRALLNDNPSLYVGSDHPVEQVSWNDAKEFCDKLNEHFKNQLPDGYVFNLPTEAQWEYACRAGTATALNNGLNLTSLRHPCPHIDKVGWYTGNSGVRGPKKVGGKKPNAWGLYDMHGNIQEWCLDSCDDYTAEDATDPLLDSFSFRRALRGGCWAFAAAHCRSASRQKGMATRRYAHVGFRLVLTPVVKENTEEN